MGEWAARIAGLGLKRAREALEDLPGILQRLELQTQGLRTWIGELDGTTSAHERQRLAETVTSLEVSSRRRARSVAR